MEFQQQLLLITLKFSSSLYIYIQNKYSINDEKVTPTFRISNNFSNLFLYTKWFQKPTEITKLYVSQHSYIKVNTYKKIRKRYINFNKKISPTSEEKKLYYNYCFFFLLFFFFTRKFSQAKRNKK